MRRIDRFSLALLAITAAVGVSSLSAQAPPGAVQPAMVELTGSWAMSNDEEWLIRIDPGPELGNFTGFPLNAAGQQKALTWNATIQAIPEHQSRAHAATYSMRGPGPNIHMGEIIDPATRRLMGYTITGLFENANRTIWPMVGRTPRSREHLWNGFSTGEWENGALHVTTHLSRCSSSETASRRAPRGDARAFIRHGDKLLLISQVDDPVYLEEPWFAPPRSGGIRGSARAGCLGWSGRRSAGSPTGDVPLGSRHRECADEASCRSRRRSAAGTLYPDRKS